MYEKNVETAANQIRRRNYLQMLEKEEAFSKESMEYLRISREKTDALRDMVDD